MPLLAFACGLVLALGLGASAAGAGAAHQGAVSVTATIKAPDLAHMPVTELSASADGYMITVSWLNPSIPASGTVVGWSAVRSHKGSAAETVWTRSDTYYSPATTARLAAPMGARYAMDATALYAGGALSIPATSSVVVTSAVDVTHSFPSTGYAASPTLKKRYGANRYLMTLRAAFAVPGGASNLKMASPVSWSPHMTSTPVMAIYVLRKRVTTPASMPSAVSPSIPPSASALYWPVAVGSQPQLAAVTYYWTKVKNARAGFADGYPAWSRYAFAPTTPGSYKFVMTGHFQDGFLAKGAATWTVTRYAKVLQTRWASKLSQPIVAGTPRTRSKSTMTGALSPKRVALLKVIIERKTNGVWKAYRTRWVRTTKTGAWKLRTRIKKRGRYRVRTSVANQVISPTREYAPATSIWRAFRVRR